MKKTAMLLTACLLVASCMIIHAEEPFHRSITVTGMGTVMAKNDMATVNLSVQTMARDAKAAARDNADIMTAVRSAVLGAGATADHIETMGYNLYPNNQYDDKGRMKSTVYEADNRMKIVLHNLDQTGKVMDAAINAGANHIDSVIFSVRNEQEYRDEALRRAVADAKRKADVIAKTLGRPVVNIISVGENHTEIMPRYAMSMKAAGDSMAENAATPMEAGTADFESHVTVVFEIV